MAERPASTTALLGVSLKMYLGRRQTRAWLRGVAELAPLPAGVELFVLPSFPFLLDAQELLAGTGVAYGVQNVWPDPTGPYTGEVSAAMAAELGCRYALIGHAERRRLFAEGPACVAGKLTAAVRSGLEPVLCVGESARLPAERAARAVVDELAACLPDTPEVADASVAIAYEPVWAIGADRPAPAEHVVAVCTAIRAALVGRAGRVRVLYGGTAGPGTLPGLRAGPTVPCLVDGLFLGRRAHDVANLRRVIAEARCGQPMPSSATE
jgi:triosephosphate isomerase